MVEEDICWEVVLVNNLNSWCSREREKEREREREREREKHRVLELNSGSN